MYKLAVGSPGFEKIGFGAFFVLFSFMQMAGNGASQELFANIFCAFETRFYLFPETMKALWPAIAIASLFISYAFGVVIFFFGTLCMHLIRELCKTENNPLRSGRLMTVISIVLIFIAFVLVTCFMISFSFTLIPVIIMIYYCYKRGKPSSSWQRKHKECLKQHLEDDAQNRSDYYLRQSKKIEIAEATLGVSLLILLLQFPTGFPLQITPYFLGSAIASIIAVKILSDETHDLLCNSQK